MVTVDINAVEGPECPNDEDCTWRLYDFEHRRLGGDIDDTFPWAADGSNRRVVNDILLAKRLDVGLAFLLAYEEHGLCRWRRGGGLDLDYSHAPYGVLVWEHGPRDIGARTYEERAQDADRFLERYSAWCNGEVYEYTVEEDGVNLMGEGCGSAEWYDVGDDLNEMFRDIRDWLPEGTKEEEITWTGNGAWLVEYHDQPKVNGSHLEGEKQCTC